MLFPSDMLRNMDEKQLKSMAQTLKKNPQLLRQMMGQAGAGGNNISDEQLQKGLDAFANMDEAQLERALKAMKGLDRMTRPFRTAYTKTNALVGGNLWKKLLVLIVVAVFALKARAVFLRGSSSASTTTSALLEREQQQQIVVDQVPDVEEFDDEF